MNKLSNLLFLIMFLAFFMNCKSDKKDNTTKVISPIKLVSPTHDTQLSIGNQIIVEYKIFDSTAIKDLKLWVNDTLYKSNLKLESSKISIPTLKANVGFNEVKISYIKSNGKEVNATRQVILFSDIVPEQKIASIVKTYPHSSASYTQGLEFYKNQLFESTGSGDGYLSFIAKTDLKSGKITKQQNLEKVYFGEGITILNDTIYQIVWQRQKCMVYNMNFEKINEFDYEGEGWGLTNNGKDIIMSNGTYEICWRSTKDFRIKKTINVFTNENDISNLNELELIGNNLYANVYLEDYIVEIDTSNGKVISKIDCAGIVSKGQVGKANVLNGIAYQLETNKLFITGKLWSSLYEIIIE